MSTQPSGWQAPRTSWQSADVPGAADFSRIESNTNAIETGARTLEPALAPTSNTGTLRQILSWIANRIKAIMGTTTWYSAPPVTLSGAKGHIDNKQNPHAVTAAQVGAATAGALNDHVSAAAPHSGHETPSGAQAKVNTHAAVQASLSQLGHVNHAVLTTTLDTSWQGSTAPYTKTQTVNGLLATDTPIVDVVMSGNFATDEARIEAWGYVYRITTADNSITLYATEKPTVSLPIQIKVVR